LIGKRIHELRLERGLSLSELADQAGVAKSYLSSIERDIQSNPSVQFLEKIGRILCVPIDVFLHDDDRAVEDHYPIDHDWREIIRELMESGVSKDEFRDFLAFHRWRLDKPGS
jgi:XRE family transcriptional regulator of biofilm formation